MQRVVRSTLVGLLAVAGLTACGDKVQTSQITLTTTPPAAGVVHSVTVSPASVTINVGGTAQLAASVDADASVTDRTVTWTSSDATVATVDGSGKVTGVKAGTVTIVASSKASPTVQGAAAVTVSGSTTVVPTVTISSLNTTVCPGTACSSVPANLQNFGTAGGNGQTGQLDVILNVDSQGQPLKSVSSTLKCGTDSLTQTQTVSGAAAPLNADASSAPVTFSFNTTQFNSTTGVAALHNGTCTISASAATAAGTQSATTSQQLTLNNADVIFATISGTKGPATDAGGLSWVGGDAKVNVVPVFYTAGRSAVSGTVILTGNHASDNTAIPVLTQSVTTFPGTVTFAAANDSTKNGLKGLAIKGLSATVSIVDNSGNTFAPGATVTGPTRIDDQPPPVAGITYANNTQNTANGWVGSAFQFSKALTIPAATGTDNNGVDNVVDSTMYVAHGGAASAATVFTSVSSIPETSTGSAYDLYVKSCDALGNCAVSANLGSFGVDITAPTFTLSTGATFLANNSITGAGVAPVTQVGVTVTDPQSSNGATGSGFSATPVLASDVRLWPNGAATGQATICTIGTNSGTAPNQTCSAPAQQGQTFTATATNPGQYALTVSVIDQAGNTSSATTLNYYIDQNAPTVTGGVAIPSSITVGSSFSAAATDSMDLANSDAVINYPILPAAVKIQAIGPSLGGVAFDNTLTRSGTVSVTMANNNFYRGMQTSTGVVAATAPVQPNQIGLRALDVAGNLSTEDVAGLPAANLSAPTAYTAAQFGAPGGTGPCAAGDPFCVTVSPTTVSNGSGNGARSTTVTATVYAASATSNTPFSQVCFYLKTPAGGVEGGAGDAVTHTAAGDLVLLGCTSTTVTTQDPALARIFQYTTSFDPAAAYGTSGTLNIVAIGSNANGDAVITSTTAALTLQP